MLKFLFIILFVSWGFSEEIRQSIKHFNKNKQAVFEFLADDVEYNKSQIIGKGNVAVINLDYFIRAQKAVYNTQTGEIILNGDVRAYKGHSLYLKAQEVHIKLQEDYSFLEPFYLQEYETGLWIDSKNAQFDNNIYQTEYSTLSTCSIYNPIWKIQASKGEYNLNKEWLSVWNPRLSIYDVPILYFPYLSFSVGFKRKSGLLYPIIGNSRTDGFMYAQPIFIAPNPLWDMTFTPQIRTKRGIGFYNEIRIIDDKNQILWLNLGMFRDTNKYQKRYGLEYKKHYGFQLEYKRKNLLTDVQDYFHEDGLYFNISQISDIDYFRIQDTRLQSNVDLQGSLLTSRLNYFLKSNDDYIGIYGRYYSDLEKTSNAKTLQTLPEIQYHRQIDNIFIDNLYYSFDYALKHYTRPVGYRAIQQEVILPLIYTQTFLNDYLNFSISPVFYMTTVNYSNIDSGLRLNNGRYFSHHYVFRANTDLMKRYSSFGHTIGFGAQYILPGADTKKGDFTDFFEIPGDQQEFLVNASQYFYDPDNILRFSHKINQTFYFENKNKRFGELENEIQYYYDYNWSFLSNILYSHAKASISEITHQLHYDGELMSGFLGHFKRKRFARNSFVKGKFGEANYINASLQKEFDHFNMYVSVGYDYKEKYLKTWQVGIDANIRCFAFGIKYVSEIYPMLTTRGAEAKNDKYVFLTIKFIPLLSSDLKIGS
ncbi:MAG: LPS-assembly protein LptD [Helicobacter sp.]|nr:LPS-assembly protein LptD [Helicobacter sp.]